jgi:eukaryotic-like serine/threonine-protein kinase
MPSPETPTNLTPREVFLAAVRDADLLTPAQLARVPSAVPPDAVTPPQVARALVAAGLLTKFQADRLLAGRTDGFQLGPYVVQDEVGRGPMGRVYRAQHRTMNRAVAVKVLSSELTNTAAAREAFGREVRAAAQLNHPNIVTAYDANDFGERSYLVLEFVDGPNLDALVRERGPLPVAEACELVRQAALGLEHAHARGMTHRGVKPANLLVTRPSKSASGPVVKIADFGISKMSAAGDPDYVAPEQTHNRTATDHRTDLYSLGAVLYFLLTGRPPFPGGTAEEKVRRHTWDEPERVERLRPDVPAPVAELVRHLLAKYPGDRPASAAEVAARLGPFATGGSTGFELPPVPGAYPIPMAEPATDGYPALGSDVWSAEAAEADTSPWEQMTVADAENDSAKRKKRRLRGRPSSSALTAWLLAGGMLSLCLIAVGVAVRLMGK